jgi:hypothetical protein
MRRSAMVLTLAACADLHAQRISVTGRVIDGDRMPIAHANVFAGRQGRIASDDSGGFVARVPTGSVRLEVRRLGYRPAVTELNAVGDTAIEIVMLQVAHGLPEERVTASAIDHLSRRGFYDRMRDGDRGLVTGYFITPEDIEARRPMRASQLLERVPGVKLLATGGSNVIPVGMNDCAMTVYLDGARLLLANQGAGKGSEGMSMQRLREGRREGKVIPEGSFDALIGVTSVTGIEIYPRGTRAPAIYQQLNGTCGIIVVWTK